jgi:hypothetical protein
MDTDIREAIERSIGEGPEQAPPHLLLARGHRALRRRRLTEAGATLAAGALVVTVTVLASGGADRATQRPLPPGLHVSTRLTVVRVQDDPWRVAGGLVERAALAADAGGSGTAGPPEETGAPRR